MELSIQIKTLIVSFVYGIILSYIVISHYKYLFESKMWYRIVLNILFIFDYTLIYFFILKIINNGVFHVYFLFLLILGYVFGYNLIRRNNN